MVFIKLLMVRGILSASFPVIAVTFSPTSIKDDAQVSGVVVYRRTIFFFFLKREEKKEKTHSLCFLKVKWKKTQVRKKESWGFEFLFAVAIQVIPRRMSSVGCLSVSLSLSSYCCY